MLRGKGSDIAPPHRWKCNGLGLNHGWIKIDLVSLSFIASVLQSEMKSLWSKFRCFYNAYNKLEEDLVS